MSADFWAGYISGAAGILVGNPLDVVKVRLQAQSSLPANAWFTSTAALAAGTAAPVLGYGALNALLFVSYNRSEAALNRAFALPGSLWTTWTAGAIGGLATWVVSTPTELIKCRAQTSAPPMSSWEITRHICRIDGIRGLYCGGAVTALRDSIGYGFYFWSYELATSRWPTVGDPDAMPLGSQARKVLLCGGLAGVVTWASVFPLDVIKTRVQTQPWDASAETVPLTSDGGARAHKRAGALRIAMDAYREGGVRVFFRGLAICSVRAFVVNAVQWAVYEWIMQELGSGRGQRTANVASVS